MKNVTTDHDKQTGTIHLKCASYDIIDSVKTQVRGDLCFYQQNDMSHIIKQIHWGQSIFHW